MTRVFIAAVVILLATVVLMLIKMDEGQTLVTRVKVCRDIWLLGLGFMSTVVK